MILELYKNNKNLLLDTKSFKRKLTRIIEIIKKQKDQRKKILYFKGLKTFIYYRKNAIL